MIHRNQAVCCRKRLRLQKGHQRRVMPHYVRAVPRQRASLREEQQRFAGGQGKGRRVMLRGLDLFEMSRVVGQKTM